MSVFSLFSMQDKLEQELEAVKAERMRAAIQAAADKQLADAQQQVYKENQNQVTNAVEQLLYFGRKSTTASLSRHG